MERDNRDEDIMMRGTKQEMPGFRFRLLRPEKKRELWNPDFELKQHKADGISISET